MNLQLMIFSSVVFQLILIFRIAVAILTSVSRSMATNSIIQVKISIKASTLFYLFQSCKPVDFKSNFTLSSVWFHASILLCGLKRVAQYKTCDKNDIKRKVHLFLQNIFSLRPIIQSL